MSDLLLELRGVSVNRGEGLALDRIDLDIRRGEHLAILGPNGSGKSTLLKLVTRELYPLPRPGTVFRMFGRDTWDVFDLRSRFGLVSNDLQAQVSRRFSVLEATLSGFFSSIGLWPGHRVTPAMAGAARAALDRAGIAHLADRPVLSLSSGEGRRLLLARALVHDPPALLLDEPTNSLDFRAAHEFRQVMATLAAEGRTLVLVTHAPEDLIPAFDRVVMLKGGRIHRDGSPADLLTAPALSDLFGLDLRVDRAEGRLGVW